MARLATEDFQVPPCSKPEQSGGLLEIKYLLVWYQF